MPIVAASISGTAFLGLLKVTHPEELIDPVRFGGRNGVTRCPSRRSKQGHACSDRHTLQLIEGGSFWIQTCLGLVYSKGARTEGNTDVSLVFQVTVADFPMYELLDQHRLMIPGVLDAYPKLTAFMNAFEALPKIKEYMASDKFMKRPINNKVAAFK